MATRSEQENISGSPDPLVEAFIRELIDGTPHPKAAKKAVTDVLAEELLASLREKERTSPRVVSLEFAFGRAPIPDQE